MSTASKLGEAPPPNHPSTTIYYPAQPTLLGLPVEVRQKILKYLLGSSTRLDDVPRIITRYKLGLDCDPCRCCGHLPEWCTCIHEIGDYESLVSYHAKGLSTSVTSAGEASEEPVVQVVGNTNTLSGMSKGSQEHGDGDMSEDDEDAALEWWNESPDQIAQHTLHNLQVSYPRYRLDGQVLRVCGQLFKEGKSLLWHEKNIGVIYHIVPGFEVSKGYVLGEASLTTALQRYIPGIRRVKLWQIGIFLETRNSHDWDMVNTLANLQSWKTRLCDDVPALSARQSLNSIEIEIHLLRPDPSTDQGELEIEYVVREVLGQCRILSAKVCRMTVDEGDKNIVRLAKGTGGHLRNSQSRSVRRHDEAAQRLSIYHDIWEFYAFDLVDPHNWHQWLPRDHSQVCTELPRFEKDDSIAALFKKWTKAVSARDIDAIPQIGNSMLDRIDNYL